jgi:AraC-like DNA-binding protein
MTASVIPMIRLAFFAPFVDELRRRGIDPSGLFDSVGLFEEAFLEEDFLIPANVMYRLAEGAAALAQDPFLAATMGSRLDIRRSELLNPRGRQLGTLADVLVCFVRGAAEHASSQVYSLSADGLRASLKGRRTFAPVGRVHQVDAWDAAAWTAVMRRLVGKKWNASEYTVRVSNPRVIPDKLVPSGCLVKGNNRGCEIVFPSAWLEARNMLRRQQRRRRSGSAPPADTVEKAVRQALSSMELSNATTLKQTAKHCGLNHRTLQRALKEAGTSYSELIEEQRRLVSMKALSSDDMSVTNLATSLGYTDLANFSRAFRRWTGMSPSGYREQHRGDG